VELVPVGSVVRYLIEPSSNYFEMILEASQSTHHGEREGRLYSYAYHPSPVILEVVGRGEDQYLQLHMLRKPNRDRH
jgi:hypothetical protein